MNEDRSGHVACIARRERRSMGPGRSQEGDAGGGQNKGLAALPACLAEAARLLNSDLAGR